MSFLYRRQIPTEMAGSPVTCLSNWPQDQAVLNSVIILELSPYTLVDSFANLGCGFISFFKSLLNLLQYYFYFMF